jgi:hypothetical protein
VAMVLMAVVATVLTLLTRCLCTAWGGENCWKTALPHGVLPYWSRNWSKP